MEWYSSPEFTELMPPMDDFSNSLSGLPGFVVTWLELTRLIRAWGVKLLLMLDRGANLLFLKTHRGHRIPSCPKALPI